MKVVTGTNPKQKTKTTELQTIMVKTAMLSTTKTWVPVPVQEAALFHHVPPPLPLDQIPEAIPDLIPDNVLFQRPQRPPTKENTTKTTTRMN